MLRLSENARLPFAKPFDRLTVLSTRLSYPSNGITLRA
jgi:hypothetical protein